MSLWSFAWETYTLSTVRLPLQQPPQQAFASRKSMSRSLPFSMSSNTRITLGRPVTAR